MKLSVIIITYNEAKFIEGCIKSALFADEVIVVDSNSTDDTVKISQGLGVKVVNHKWSGFATQKTYAASLAHGEWLFFLDADERITPKLRSELTSLPDSPANVYLIPRLNYLIGQKMLHGGWFPDYQQRLVKKADFISWQGELHEHLEVTNRVDAKLVNHLVHFSHRSPKSMLEKTISYAGIEAKLRFDAHHPPVKLKHFIAAMGKEFYYRALKNQGWKDGLVGWIEILYQTCNAFIIYFFLWEMQRKSDLDTTYSQLIQKFDQQEN